jgi:hypothetical protein
MVTVAELKAKCKENGLPVSGTKQVLQTRLDEHASRNSAAGVATPSPSYASEQCHLEYQEETNRIRRREDQEWVSLPTPLSKTTLQR